MLSAAAAGLALSGCITSQPLALSNDNPANAKAAAGFVDEPTAIADYKSADDLAIRAAAEAKAPPSSTANMPGMSGMPGMGGMNMQGGGAPQSGKPQ
jgi:hypothetical protein